MKSKLMIHLFGGINGSNSFHWWESMEFGGFEKKKEKTRPTCYWRLAMPICVIWFCQENLWEYNEKS